MDFSVLKSDGEVFAQGALFIAVSVEDHFLNFAELGCGEVEGAAVMVCVLILEEKLLVVIF